MILLYRFVGNRGLCGKPIEVTCKDDSGGSSNSNSASGNLKARTLFGPGFQYPSLYSRGLNLNAYKI